MSKTATCGVFGKAVIACSIPDALAGLCSGASTDRSRICCSTDVSTKHGITEVRAAVDDSVADSSQFPAIQRPSRFVEQVLHRPQSCSMVRYLVGMLDGAAAECVGRPAGGFADSFDDTRGNGGSGRHVDKLILHGRRPGVENQNDCVHRSAVADVSCAWIAVIATVLTMSATSAPRDRSFTGRFRPCSTGPIATAPALRCTAL